MSDYKGYTYSVDYDDYPINPREDYDHLCTIAIKDNRYFSGDESLSVSEFQEIVKDQGIIKLPVYAYIHSSVSLSVDNSRYPFNDSWDSGLIGLIYVSKDQVRTEWKVSRISPKLLKTIFDSMRAEISEYSAYLSGEVYYYTVKDKTGEVLDSCCGFFDYNDCIQQAKESIDYYVSLDWKKEQETQQVIPD